MKKTSFLVALVAVVLIALSVIGLMVFEFTTAQRKANATIEKIRRDRHLSVSVSSTETTVICDGEFVLLVIPDEVAENALYVYDHTLVIRDSITIKNPSHTFVVSVEAKDAEGRIVQIWKKRYMPPIDMIPLKQ
ncbi:MAG: hypothetical protein HGA67_04520 [Candidatus Yonathbacteria bacterium]|nr:hypothetical protein [Candidatus Yonathbacteria bacterium]